ncbi:MAG TPA: inorganic phosphate transporter [Methanoregulaceae archaeon]|nr:inorganic phosphate transporter [Methanoregulaceae archaeon]HQJ88003.1 inorganic phosphate transporter [Methanoregulaceae archaeon]
MEVVAVAALILSFAFIFTTGFQDAASIAASFIASRSATPRQGIVLITTMNVLGAIFGGSAVASTLSGLIVVVEPEQTTVILLAALLSATAWNLLTWWRGLPSSSTHALVGGLIGAAVAGNGIGGVHWGLQALTAPSPGLVGFTKVLVFLLASVAIGLLGGFAVQRTISVLLRNAHRRNTHHYLVRANWTAAILMAFFNGANDSQKQLGIIALALFAAGETTMIGVPFWARAVCAAMLGLGTLSGGWRIMNTLGRHIFRIAPVHSFSSEVASSVTITAATLVGAPVSSSHITTGSILGVGAAENPRRMNWNAAWEVILAMLTTIPATSLLAAGIIVLSGSIIIGA